MEPAETPATGVDEVARGVRIELVFDSCRKKELALRNAQMAEKNEKRQPNACIQKTRSGGGSWQSEPRENTFEISIECCSRACLARVQVALKSVQPITP
jgi:hypothetical protein